MKNPWMSLWLSAANQWAGAARAFWSAETARQQQSFAKEVAKAWGFGPRPARKPAAGRRRKSAESPSRD